MSPLARLLAFAAVLAALAAAGFGFGRALDTSAPGGEQGATQMDTHMERGPSGVEQGPSGGHGAAHGVADPVRGLGVAEHGLRLEVDDPAAIRAAAERLRFRIVDESGEPVTTFDLTHTRRMHVIVVRRDLTGFQHLHPEMAVDGTWSVPLRLDRAGTYRVFADFAVDGEATTLAADLRVDGAAELRELPAPATRALSQPGRYRTDLRTGDPRAGEAALLRFAVSRDGEPAALQPYLGAGGHLVALREGDLAFLHVHPAGDPGEDGSIDFEATFPTAGRYRLFLQYVVDGELQTVAFTAEVR